MYTWYSQSSLKMVLLKDILGQLNLNVNAVLLDNILDYVCSEGVCELISKMTAFFIWLAVAKI